MDDNSNIIIPFLSEHFFYWMGFLFPTISVFCGWIIYYGLHHHNSQSLPTISRSFIQFPENRLFAVCMSIESCILGAIFYIRHKLILKMDKRYSQRKTNDGRKNTNKMSIPVLNHICDRLAFTVCICLSGLSLVTLEDNRIIHLIFARVFWTAFLFYYIISDLAAIRAQFSVGFISRILPYFTAIYIILNAFLIIRCKPEELQKAKNNFAISQYVIAFLLFFKILLIGYDNPPHDLVSSSSKMKVKLA